jgi:hypothetical protein
MTIPSRKYWNTLKKKYDVPDGAVGGVNLGSALDKITKAKNVAEQTAAVKEFEKAAHTYITKIDKKKVTDHDKFQKEFLDEFLAPASQQLRNVKLAADGKELYKSELRKFFQAVQKLDAKNSRGTDVQAFVQFARGLTSVGVRTKKVVDPTEINKYLARIAALDDKLNYKTATQQDFAKFIAETIKIAQRIEVSAKKQSLV